MIGFTRLGICFSISYLYLIVSDFYFPFFCKRRVVMFRYSDRFLHDEIYSYSAILPRCMSLPLRPSRIKSFWKAKITYSCQHAELKPRTDLTGLTSETFSIGQNPIQTYWFVTATDAHIVAYLSDGSDDGNRVFLELSRKKSSFNFPDDYSIEIGGYNDVTILLKGKEGRNVQLDPGKKSKLHVHVDLLDPQHLKISFDGVLSSRQLPNEAIPVNGKISLSSRSPLAQKLPDHYDGCDNTIYNTMSPGFDLGQWRSASACETSFHHKVWSTLNEALEPAIAYLQSKQWLCEKVKENKVTRV